MSEYITGFRRGLMAAEEAIKKHSMGGTREEAELIAKKFSRIITEIERTFGTPIWGVKYKINENTMSGYFEISYSKDIDTSG